jgi:drug/metabolite transporter (DMT)-like permease
VIEVLAARPALAALAGALTIAFSAILVALAGVSPSTAAVFRCAYALPVLGAVAVAERRRHGPPPKGSWWRGAAAGAFFAADLILWHHAIADIGAGLATVLANLQVVLVAVAAWLLLDEDPAPLQLAGVAVVVVGIVVATRRGSERAVARS